MTISVMNPKEGGGCLYVKEKYTSHAVIIANNMWF